VIAIITLLVGLLLPAINKIRDAALRAKTKSEIAELSNATESFKTTYDVKYIPTAFILSNNYNPPNGASAAEIALWNDSRKYYASIWPKAFLPVGPPPMAPGPGFTPLGQDAAGIQLDGNQCLVFFLGGIPPTNNRFPASFQGNRSGFLNSPTNPFNLIGGAVREPALKPDGTTDPTRAKGPFFDFKLDRVNENAHVLDPYGTPYYYFSSKNGNDYNYFGAYQLLFNPNPATPNRGFNQMGGYGSMCPFIGLDGKYLNASTFQIISAGKDKLPGPGGFDVDTGLVNPYEAGIGKYSPGGPGGDDVSNFTTGPLGGEGN
jgi:hypothetical protein